MIKLPKFKLPKINILTGESNQESVVDVIDQIHDKFNTASASMLEEAKQILKKSEELDGEELKKLEDLGFTQFYGLKEAKKIEKIKEQKEREANFVNYYSIHYPSHKFITHERTLEICEKYNLLLGNPTDYIAPIPKYVRKDIINFKLRKADVVYLVDEDYESGRSGDMIRSTNIHYSKRTFETNKTTWMKDTKNGKSLKQKIGESRKGKAMHRTFYTNENYFKIVAAPDMFNLKDKRIEKGQIIEDRVETVPDPVALKPVKGGYLIVKAWGKEAEMLEFQNPTNN